MCLVFHKKCHQIIANVDYGEVKIYGKGKRVIQFNKFEILFKFANKLNCVYILKEVSRNAYFV